MLATCESQQERALITKTILTMTMQLKSFKTLPKPQTSSSKKAE